MIQTLAQELNKDPRHVENVVRLLDEGNTIPFIARYRKELHGAMDDTSLRTLEERLQYLRGLEERRDTVKKSIEEQGKLTEELAAAIDSAQTLAEVEDLYRPYKQKRRTRATVAREKGLEPLAALLFAQERDCPRPEDAAAGFIDSEKGVETAADALQGANDIIAEWISDDAVIRKSLRELLERRGALRSLAATEEDSVYRLYYNFEQSLSRLQGHQILAINRGEKEEKLKVTVLLDRELALPLLRRCVVKPGSAAMEFVKTVHIIGVQANLWTEYIPTYSQLEYMELPRLAALSEVQWTLPEKKNYDNFLQRLPKLISVYDDNGYNYAKHVFNVKAEYITDYTDNSIKVVLSAIGDSPIYYTLDGSEPTEKSQQYTDTLALKESCVLKAVTIRRNAKSAVLTEKIDFNKATAKPLILLQPINEKYKYNGEYTLVDGLSGTPNYRTGRWIAFYKNDMELVVDLKQETSVHKAWVRTYVEIGEEILDVRSISVLSSADGKIYKELKTVDYPAVTSKDKNGIYKHEVDFDTVNARYIKIIAKPEYKIPSWHWGSGRPAFIFVDEVGLE